MRGTIEQAQPSKSGKTLGVKVNGAWLTTKHWELQNHVGKEIVCETDEQNFNGTTIRWLNKYTFVDPNANPQPQASRPAAPASNKDQAIIMQSLAKATLSPEMTDEQIKARVGFLWQLAGKIVNPPKPKPEPQLSEPLPDPEFGQESGDFDDPIPW